jgi:DNA processing protein
LALALGPAPTRERLLAWETPLGAIVEHWSHRRAYAAWEIARDPDDLLCRMHRDLVRLAGRGVHVVLASDAGYPSALVRLRRAPALLYVQGKLPAEPLVAIVGSRGARLEGVRAAGGLARDLAEAGLGIVSGGAIGIDAAAHEGALDVGGRTLAVLGSGLERLYPARNSELFVRIAAQGALVTEHPPETPPRAAYFPQRNRIIAALAKAVLVVEAGLRSGALITAEWGRRLGVPVLALDRGAGGRTLLRRGAGHVIHARDVLAVLSGAPPREYRDAPGDAETRATLELLAGTHSVTVDELAERLGLGVSRAAALLIRLELRSLVRALPGGRFAGIRVRAMMRDP